MKLLLLGDVSPTQANNEIFEKEDIATLFNDTTTLFEDCDLKFVNLECALTDSDNAIEKYGPNLKATKKTAAVLKKLGVNLAGLSNNHIFDFGIEGYLDTVKALDEAGIDYTGFGKNYEDSRKNYIFEKDGERVAIIAVCEHEYSYALENRMGSRPFDCYDTIADVRAAKAECDRVVVIYHGGKEHFRYPSPRMVKLCHALVDNGADIIIGQHSHCICCYENYKDGHILYGQGNFHFVAHYEDLPDWDSEMAVKYDTKTNTVEFIPTTQTDVGIELAKGDKKKELESIFKSLCESMKDGSWKDGWHNRCQEKYGSYEKRLKRVFVDDASEREVGVFGHYLDCEAHHDVIVEIHKTANHTNEL